ncbi:MAG: GTP-binding protein [Oscillospiraceae bacterium]|nr:GTP-binding protein [Oscillospiraceae bacterium]
MATEVPVYLFTGFLEGGKSTLIQETMEDPKFNSGERTLLLLCEEGEVELDPAAFADGGKGTFVKVVEDEADLNPKTLDQWRKEVKAERVLVEYNGMWQLQSLFQNLPEGWIIYQEVLLVDGSTFLTYNANMRSLVVDKLTTCEMVVFNRCIPSVDRMMLHQIVRATSRRTDIIYENDGEVDFDDIEDPLPFDLDAPVVEIADRDYALWYRDAAEDPRKYSGKTVRFKAMTCLTNRLPKDQFIPGRFVMTCCEADTTFMGFICKFPGCQQLKQRSWITVTATVRAAKHPLYRGELGPILTAVSVEPAQPAEQEIATFY